MQNKARCIRLCLPQCDLSAFIYTHKCNTHTMHDRASCHKFLNSSFIASLASGQLSDPVWSSLLSDKIVGPLLNSNHTSTRS